LVNRYLGGVPTAWKHPETHLETEGRGLCVVNNHRLLVRCNIIRFVKSTSL
jgi:hypothetical protein